MEKEEEEREGGETMDDVIRTAKEVKTFEQILAFFLRRLMSISNQVRRLIRGSSVTSCASSELVPLQEDRSLTIYINVLGSSASCFHGSTCRVEAKVLGHFGPPRAIPNDFDILGLLSDFGPLWALAYLGHHVFIY